MKEPEAFLLNSAGDGPSLPPVAPGARGKQPPRLSAPPAMPSFPSAPIRGWQAAPPAYRPPQGLAPVLKAPAQGVAVQSKPKVMGPPVYRPHPASKCAPQGSPDAGVLQSKTQLTAPPVFRPQQSSPPTLITAGGAPPVYRPALESVSVQAKQPQPGGAPQMPRLMGPPVDRPQHTSLTAQPKLGGTPQSFTPRGVPATLSARRVDSVRSESAQEISRGGDSRPPHPASLAVRCMGTLQLMRPRRTTVESAEEYAEKSKVYRQLEAKGREIYQKLIDAISAPDADDVERGSEFDKRYETKISASEIPSNVSGIVSSSSGFLGASTTVKGGSDLAYGNYIDVNTGC